MNTENINEQELKEEELKEEQLDGATGGVPPTGGAPQQGVKGPNIHPIDKYKKNPLHS